MSFQEYVRQMKLMIDRLKALCSDLGLANTGDEYKIISELFTYKFLNDKLLYEFDKREDKTESFDEFVYYVGANTAKMKKEHLISELFNQQNEEDFHVIFDTVLQEVSELNKDIYAIEIYHSEATAQQFTVNGIELTVPANGYRTKIGGTLGKTVTIPTGVNCIVGRLE